MGIGFTIEQKKKKKKKKDIWVNINNYIIHDTQKKMGLKKNHDITQGNNENKRGVVRTMQTKVKEFTAQ